MSSFTLSKVSAVQTRGALGQVKRRWLHGSLKRQAILMPAMSPLMMEGTITCWKKKEGEAFVAGDVLLQIQSDFYMIDVEAQCPGILGKILMPDGTSNIPVEQVIALVARDMNELAVLQNQSSLPIPPAFNSLPAPPSSTVSSPRHLDQFKPLSSPCKPTMSPRTPSLFEMHTMGYSQRSAHVGGPRGTLPKPLESVGLDGTSPYRLDVPPFPSSRIQQQLSSPSTPSTARWPNSAVDGDQERAQVDGAAIRRMIVSNLSSQQTTKTIELDELL